MAREVTITILCDECQEQDRRTPATPRGLIKLGNAEGELELCDDCWDTLAERLYQLLKRAGHPPEKTDPTTDAQKGKDGKDARAAAKAIREGTRFPCPLCEMEVRGRSGLQGHLQRMHDRDLAEFETKWGHTVDGRTLTMWCAECGAGYAEGRGVGLHQRSKGHTGKLNQPPATDMNTVEDQLDLGAGQEVET